MKFAKTFSALCQVVLIVAISAIALSFSGNAKADEDVTPYYPLKSPRYAEWSFAGPFGTWDIGQLQRGLKIYTEVCAACHSLDLIPFRSLYDLGYNDAQVKSFAAEYEVTDGPNAEGEMFERTAVPADRFPGPYSNSIEAALANNGAVPPDFSLMAKARAPKRGFPNFVFDVFTAYAENGPDYIYSMLTGYSDAPEGVELGDDVHYNLYFAGGVATAMAAPLSDDMVDYDDGTPQTLDQYAKDISAFLMWTAEPSLVERKKLGFKVMFFLLVFAVLLYFTKRQVFASLKD